MQIKKKRKKREKTARRLSVQTVKSVCPRNRSMLEVLSFLSFLSTRRAAFSNGKMSSMTEIQSWIDLGTRQDVSSCNFKGLELSLKPF